MAQLPRPTLNPDPDFREMIQACEDYLTALQTDYSEDDGHDIDVTIVEKILRALYGENIFAFINQCLKERGILS